MHSPRPLWTCWPSVQRLLLAKQLALFLDYDGTLTPIVNHPAKAKLDSRMKGVLQQLARQPGVWVAWISGRGLKELKSLVGLKGFFYVGNHGLELEGPKLRYVNPTAHASRPVLKRAALTLCNALRSIPGVWVEDKGLTLSVHYRSVPSKLVVLARDRFFEVLAPFMKKRQLKVTMGQKVWEVRPPTRWNKGAIVRQLLSRQIAMAVGTVLPIYVGDDQTDEDAFKTLKGRGITIAVGPTSMQTQADYAVRSPQDVHRFLRLILRGRDGTAKIPAVS